MEEAGLDGADLSNALLVNAYLTSTIADAAKISGADFSDAVLPSKTQKILCGRKDATGTNTKSGVDTRESLICPD